MNHSIFVIKVIENPIHVIYPNKQKVVEVIVQFASPRRKNDLDQLRMVIWGNLRDDFMQYYRLNDYLLVEGIISLRNIAYNNNNKEVELTIKRMYPYLLNEEALYEKFLDID